MKLVCVQSCLFCSFVCFSKIEVASSFAMSVMNNYRLTETENVSNRLHEVKKFGASNNQSEVKKKALADVGNVLHQKSVQRVSKPSATFSKQNVVGKNLFNIFNSKENKNLEENKPKQVEKTHNLLLSAMEDINDGIVETVCSCQETDEGDFADFMLNDIKLPKNQIEDLALVWQNTPTFTASDKYEIDAMIPYIPEIDCLSFTYQKHMEDMVEFDWDVSKLPEPATPYDLPYDDEEDLASLCNGLGCYEL
ncbi:uncharacterized protein LOC124352778 isoform X3 [Homalodisca vitripennis]|uniref:uncharacterized protein LOC124352778 isoform X3 n=1 Tax=Homalodisca vitripennis TaxID=197043 RepID=UPI001EEC8C6D|nr:uncharacterized protein LOC124352778 isoform X3 [Homalodisca vitripennis]